MMNKNKNKQEDAQRWACGVCSYAYISEQGDSLYGIAPGTLFDELPDDWRCPWCGALKSEFYAEQAQTGNIMKNIMNTTLRQDIDWVGYVDWTVRDFHSYHTARGATYNAYLLRDEKTALIDTVKAPFAESLLARIATLTDLAKVDYVVCNHAEPDHAGALSQVMAALPNATLLCNKKCSDTLSMYHDTSRWKIQQVGTGQTVSLGRRTLQFIDTPMVHWPESMFTYVPEEKLLFSMDAFGQHYATSQRFDDEEDLNVIMEEAKSYYANIIMFYGKRVQKVLAQASELEIEMIAPSHGLIWRKYIPNIIAAYKDWAACRAQPKVLVVYDSMWKSTERMARAILEGASSAGVQAKLIHVRHSSRTRIVMEILDAAAVAFGSPTLNNCMMPEVAALLTYLKGLRPMGKAGMAFGSYGWGRGGPKAINEWLEEMKWDILHEPIEAQYRPLPKILETCRAAGGILAERALQVAGEE